MRVPRNRIGIFKNQIGLLEALLEVALPGFSEMRDIRAGLRKKPRATGVVSKVGVNEHSVIPQRLGEIEDRFEFLVNHLDQLRGAFRRFGVVGDNRGDLFTHKTNPIGGENEPVLHVQAEPVREILSRHHAHDAGDLLRRRGVDALNERVGVWALDNLRVQQVWPKREVVHISGSPGDFLQSVNARGRLAYKFQWFAHFRPPALPEGAETARIASMIGW